MTEMVQKTNKNLCIVLAVLSIVSMLFNPLFAMLNSMDNNKHYESKLYIILNRLLITWLYQKY